MPTTAVIIIDAVNRGWEFLEGTTLGGGTAMTLRTGRRAAVTLTSSCRTPKRIRRQRAAEGAGKDANGTGIADTELPDRAGPPSYSDSRRA